MALRQANLGPLKAGITRLRDKGGASPESLYDLLNGYVDASGAPTSRDGTSLDVTLPAGTKGLCAFDGKLHTFALTVIDPPTPGYVVNVLIHPDAGFAGTITAIHFAKPFLGYLYVVAEFSDGQVIHYWLQSKDAWQPNTIYLDGQAVRPSSANGFIYAPTTSDKPQAWQPATQYAVGDAVQPTTYNGYKYVVTEIDGSNPTSGATEPTWIAAEGAEIVEDVDATPAANTTTQTSNPGGDRYSNLPGYKGAQLDAGA